MNMQLLSRTTSLFLFLVFASPTLAADLQPGTDDPAAFYSCFYIGNIVDDAQDPDTPEMDLNEISFHDGRAIQLYAMGKLADGHSKQYIEANMGKIADFARAVPEISETTAKPDWYDGRVASLAGVLFCAEDDTNNDDLSDTLPRQSCPLNATSLFPEGSVLERMKRYMQPCCVLSEEGDDIEYFPCALQ
jgi:hypothetical protein